MKRTLTFCVLVVGLMTLGLRSVAQGNKPVTLELDLDFRSRLAAVGKSRTALHTTSLTMDADLGAGFRLNINGMRKYTDDFVAHEATVEKNWGTQRLQLGIVRLPFGIYDHRETYASGLIDYPMSRVDYGNHAVDWGVPGVQFSGGTAKFQVEAAVFNGRLAGTWNNNDDVGGSALRMQTYYGGLILGASRWDGYYTNPGANLHKPVHLNGLDLRYTRSHLVLRGEYLFGDLGGIQMRGWYLDAYYRLPKYEKVTLALRLEELAPGGLTPGKQITLGVRYMLDRDWTFVVNWRRNNGSESYPYSWTPYAGKGGDVFVQVYRKIRF